MEGVQLACTCLYLASNDDIPRVDSLADCSDVRVVCG